MQCFYRHQPGWLYSEHIPRFEKNLTGFYLPGFLHEPTQPADLLAETSEVHEDFGSLRY